MPQKYLNFDLDVKRSDEGFRATVIASPAGEASGEYLYSPELDRFLSLSAKTPIVRHVPGAVVIAPLPVTPPLRVLVMVADPSDYPRLDAEREWANLRRAIGEAEQKGLVSIDRVDGGSLGALQARLRRARYHVLHFVGHGLYDEDSGQGTVIFESGGGQGLPMRGQELGTLVNDYPSLRLIVLNACEAGRSGTGDPFAGVAQALVRQQIPAVVAMQNEISDDAAVTFSKEFYGALADGASLDVALVESRRALYGDGYPLEWGTAVLYTLSADGQIFDIGPANGPRLPQAVWPPAPPLDVDTGDDADDSQITVEEVTPITFAPPAQPSRAMQSRTAALIGAPTGLLAVVFLLNWVETWIETQWTSAVSEKAMTAAATMRWIERYLQFQNPDSPASWSTTTAIGMWTSIYGYSTAYFLVFPLLGVAVAAALMRNRRREAYRVFAMALVIDYILSLAFFLFFPVPERWAIPESGAVLLSDLWTPNLIKGIRWISALDNCFPSSHVSMTVVTIVVSYIYELRLRTVVAALGSLVILSTFVLGIHWIPDMVAGAAVATISVWAAKRLERWYGVGGEGPQPIG